MHVQTILTPVSIGELIDKITILEIKAERITDAAKLDNVRTELDGLWPLWLQQQAARPELAALKQQLKAINERMWDIQDQLRAKETAQDFGAEFITLARGVYGCAANQGFLIGKFMPKFLGRHVQNFKRFSYNFRPNAIARQNTNMLFHVISLNS